MDIAANLRQLIAQLPGSVRLIAVSKTKPNHIIRQAYDAGQRIFGENRVQELVEKQPELPQDIEWHFIGHMQTNKVKYIAPFVSLIHSVDSLKLLKEINKQAARNNRTIDCLLQFHIAEETSKFGLSVEEAVEMVTSETYSDLNNTRIIGVMGMSTFTDDMHKVRKEFKTLKGVFDKLKESHFHDADHFREVSMGMSGDFMVAIEEGSTMVRIGTSIFGARHQ